VQTSSSPHHALRGPDRWFHARSGAGDEPVLDFGRLLLGGVIVTIGALFLLDAAGALDAGRAISRWWPSVLVAAGLLTLAERPPGVFRGAVLSAIGAVALLFTTDVLGDSAWAYVWPAAIVVAGVAVLARWSGRGITAGEHGEDVIRSTAVFGGSELASADQAFRGAWLTAIFGGITLDLREARPVDGGATVNATVAFGGADVLVPKGWRVAIRSVPIFGGVDDETDRSVPLAHDAPTLYVDAVCVFGGVGVKHEK
jgi:hypothetical protein